jgi:hypothetical protein
MVHRGEIHLSAVSKASVALRCTASYSQLHRFHVVQRLQRGGRGSEQRERQRAAAGVKGRRTRTRMVGAVVTKARQGGRTDQDVITRDYYLLINNLEYYRCLSRKNDRLSSPRLLALALAFGRSQHKKINVRRLRRLQQKKEVCVRRWNGDKGAGWGQGVNGLLRT